MINKDIKTGGAFEVDSKMSLRKTADIKDDIGQLVRIGFMNDTESWADVGSVVSKDFKKGLILIRSFNTGNLIAYDMNGTNSNVISTDDFQIALGKRDDKGWTDETTILRMYK
tara:strand:- start:117 stop:455 length:339 start_codon:yes stop_codon:yes gene_type:complete